MAVKLPVLRTRTQRRAKARTSPKADKSC
jgi:hypothetical protein